MSCAVLVTRLAVDGPAWLMICRIKMQVSAFLRSIDGMASWRRIFCHWISTPSGMVHRDLYSSSDIPTGQQSCDAITVLGDGPSGLPNGRNRNCCRSVLLFGNLYMHKFAISSDILKPPTNVRIEKSKYRRSRPLLTQTSSSVTLMIFFFSRCVRSCGLFCDRRPTHPTP